MPEILPPTDESTHRPGLVAVMGVMFVLSAVLAAIIATILQAVGRDAPELVSWSFLHVLCVVYVWSMVCTPVILWTLTVRIGPEGVTARTFWGTQRTVAWTEIANVRPRWGFWIVYSKDTYPPLWLGRFLQRRRAIAKALGQGE